MKKFLLFAALAGAVFGQTTIPDSVGVYATSGSSSGGGSGTISPGSTNTLPKYTASTTVGNSLATDNGTTLSYSGTGGVSTAGPVASGVGSGVTGKILITPVTSGTFDVTAADALAQSVHIVIDAQTGGATTLHITDQAGTSRNVVFDTLTQALTNKTINGNTFTAGTYTLTGAAAKTLNFTNSLTFSGTDGTTMTFPSTSATLARTDAANTFTGTQTFSNNLVATAGTNSLAAFVDSVDGTTPLNNIIQTVASGTAYTLTATSAAVTFGTTSPIVTLANAGTYWISFDIQYSYVGATFAANRQFDEKLRRTNNTAADVTGSTFSEFVPTLTTITDAGPHAHVGPVLYTTANTTDTIQVFADISVLPTAGTVTVTNCTITAMRAF